jgi:hypothetical protein
MNIDSGFATDKASSKARSGSARQRSGAGSHSPVVVRSGRASIVQLIGEILPLAPLLGRSRVTTTAAEAEDPTDKEDQRNDPQDWVHEPEASKDQCQKQDNQNQSHIAPPRCARAPLLTAPLVMPPATRLCYASVTGWRRPPPCTLRPPGIFSSQPWPGPSSLCS